MIILRILRRMEDRTRGETAAARRPRAPPPEAAEPADPRDYHLPPPDPPIIAQSIDEPAAEGHERSVFTAQTAHALSQKQKTSHSKIGFISFKAAQMWGENDPEEAPPIHLDVKGKYMKIN